MDIEPIKTQSDYERALRQAEALWGAEPGTPPARALDVLATLIDAYEREHYPVTAGEPVETITVHMEMTGRTQRDLSALLGSASRASELLNRKRSLTMEMAHKLHVEWGIPADALIVPYELKRA